MQTLEPVKLTYCRPIKFRKRRTKEEHKGKARFVTDSDRLMWGGILDKNIQTYEMWFRFLKLALELESLKATLVVKRNMKKGSKEADTVQKIKVDRSKYEGWGLEDDEQVLKGNFKKWWSSHRHLFLDEGVQVLKPDEKVGSEDGCLYVKINFNRRLRDINKTLRTIIKGLPVEHKSQAKFRVTGNPRPLVLQNRYNALVLKLEDKLSDKDIINFKNKHLRPSDGRTPTKYNTAHTSRVMFGLISGNERILGAKGILLNVCDGYFVTNPNKPKKQKTPKSPQLIGYVK